MILILYQVLLDYDNVCIWTSMWSSLKIHDYYYIVIMYVFGHLHGLV